MRKVELRAMEQMLADIHLQSTNYGFMCDRESKDLIGDMTLDEYTELVIRNNQFASGSRHHFYNDEDTAFYYVTYSATIDGKDFVYFVATFISDDYYYVINFFCLQKNLDKYNEQFMKWTKTIRVS